MAHRPMPKPLVSCYRRVGAFEGRVIDMPFWQRMLVTLIAMAVASLVIGLIWREIFGFELPSYLAGVIGGLTALPVWEFLKRVVPRSVGAPPR
jgi:uncharacterized membrane protein YhaH (DUF805 family)